MQVLIYTTVQFPVPLPAPVMMRALMSHESSEVNSQAITIRQQAKGINNLRAALEESRQAITVRAVRVKVIIRKPSSNAKNNAYMIYLSRNNGRVRVVVTMPTPDRQLRTRNLQGRGKQVTRTTTRKNRCAGMYAPRG